MCLCKRLLRSINSLIHSFIIIIISPGVNAHWSPMSHLFLTRWVSQLLGLALVSWAFARIGVHRPSLHLPYLVFSIRSYLPLDFNRVYTLRPTYRHSFIADIYIAPLQVGLLRSAPNPVRLNNVVLICWRNFWEQDPMVKGIIVWEVTWLSINPSVLS